MNASRKRWVWLGVVAVVAVILAVGGKILHDNFHAVIPGEVYRSAQLGPGTLRGKMERHDIRTIVNLRGPDRGRQQDWYLAERAVAEEFGATMIDIDLKNHNLRVDELRDLMAVMEEAERPLYVHCRSGMDRSGLASVMALLLAGEHDLDEVAEQTSWRYLVYKPDSVGRTFLADYRSWLEAEGLDATPARLRRWLNHEYVDPTGNIHYLVDPIDGQTWFRPHGRYADGVTFTVRRDEPGPLVLSGWAFDTHRVGPLAGLRWRLGDQRLPRVRYGLDREELVRDFGKAAYVPTGWRVEVPRQTLPAGCHDLAATFTRRDGTTWDSPPEARLCIE